MGFEPARQRYIASQKPNALPADLSGLPTELSGLGGTTLIRITDLSLTKHSDKSMVWHVQIKYSSNMPRDSAHIRVRLEMVNKIHI